MDERGRGRESVFVCGRVGWGITVAIYYTRYMSVPKRHESLIKHVRLHTCKTKQTVYLHLA